MGFSSSKRFCTPILSQVLQTVIPMRIPLWLLSIYTLNGKCSPLHDSIFIKQQTHLSQFRAAEVPITINIQVVKQIFN